MIATPAIVKNATVDTIGNNNITDAIMYTNNTQLIIIIISEK